MKGHIYGYVADLIFCGDESRPTFGKGLLLHQQESPRYNISPITRTWDENIEDLSALHMES